MLSQRHQMTFRDVVSSNLEEDIMLRVRSTYGHRLLLSIRHSMIGISIAVDSTADHGRRHAPKLSAFLERWLSEVYINHKSMKT